MHQLHPGLDLRAGAERPEGVATGREGGDERAWIWLARRIQIPGAFTADSIELMAVGVDHRLNP